MKCRRLALTLAGVTAVVGLTACSSYATPDTSQVGLAYTGGSWDSKAFQKCIAPGGNEVIDNGGETFYYPAGTRTWTFSTMPGADSGPILVSTANNQELVQSGTITFTLNTDCTPYTDAQGRAWPGGPLQAFHDKVGRSAGAFFTDESTQVPQGWRDTLGKYLGGPANRVMDLKGGEYTWEQLYADPTKVNEWIGKVKTDIPAQLAALSGGDTYFTIVDIQLDKPDLPPGLKAQFQQAEVDRKTRENAAANQAAASQFPGGPVAQQEWRAREADIALKEAEATCLANAQCPKILNTVPR